MPVVGADGQVVTEADRRDAVERLQRHAAPGGALTAEELADRVRRVYAAQTHAGIDQVFLGLPPQPPLWSTPAALLPEPTSLQPPRVWSRNTLAYFATAVLVVALLGVLVLVMTIDDDPTDRAGLPSITRKEQPATGPGPTTRPTTTTSTPPSTTTLPPHAPEPIAPLPDPFAPPLVLMVGTDIDPGLYVSAPQGGFCYWARLSGLGGSVDEIIQSGIPNGGHVLVEILAGDLALSSAFCGDWQPYAAPETPASVAEDGDWMVGSDVVPGTYRLVPSAGSACIWERASGFTHDIYEMIDAGFPDGEAVVELRSGERFSSQNCGTWILE